MTDHTNSSTERKVLGWITLSMDGFAAGPSGDMSWVAEHVGHDQMMAYSEGIWRGVSTAVMGRTNYEGFVSIIRASLDRGLLDEFQMHLLPVCSAAAFGSSPIA